MTQMVSAFVYPVGEETGVRCPVMRSVDSDFASYQSPTKTPALNVQ